MWKNIFIFCIGIFLFPQCFAEVFITSIFPNTEDDKNLEYIELYNASGNSVDISGYSISDISGKEYVFGSGTILESKIFTEFFRTETKIILNNTNEEVFLKDPSGELLDSISYSSSVKGERITFLEKLESDENMYSQEVFISGEAIISDEISPIDSGGGETKTPEEIIVPEVSWVFQQPSYVTDKEAGLSEYFCDPEKDECKINFDFSESFRDNFTESEYRCEIDFGFFTGEEHKCNPVSISFPEGDTLVYIKIISKKDIGKYSSAEILIHNLKEIPVAEEKEEEEIIKDQEEPELEPEPKGETESEEAGESPLQVSIPPVSSQPEQIVIKLQSPSYIFPTGEESYSCDRNKEVCKINFDIRSSFSEVSESDYTCHLDFGFETGEEEKCNPNTIEIPLGEHNFSFQIYEKNSGSLIIKKVITVENLGMYTPEEKPLTVSRGYKASDFIDITKPVINIQSGLYENGGKYYCEKEKCRVNLEYIKKHDSEKCLWFFGEGIYKQSSLTRCNPGFIEYEGGIHRIGLKVYQSNNKTNYQQSKLVFENFPENGEAQEEISLKQDIQQEDFSLRQLLFIVQGRIGKNKTLSGNHLECIAKESCSVNFTSDIIFSGSLTPDLQYIWDFGNGEYFEGENPKSIQYELGDYTVLLTLKKGEEAIETQKFFISVKSPKDEEIVSKVISEEKVFSGSLRIVSLIPNPVGNDIREWIELQNTGLTDIDLRECYIKNGSKKSKLGGDILYPFQFQKVFRVFSNFSLSNGKDSIEIYCGDILQDSLDWEEKIDEGYILFSDGSQEKQEYEFGRKDFKSLENYKEFIEKTWKANIRKLKSGVKISGETLANTRVRIHSSQGKEIFITTDENGIFEILLDTQVSLGKVSFSFEMQDIQGDIFVFEDNEMLNITSLDKSNFLLKYIKKSRKKKEVVSQEKETILSVEQTKKEKQESSLSILRKGMFVFGLCILGLIFFIFLLPQETKRLSLLDFYSQIFETKLKVSLLL